VTLDCKNEGSELVVPNTALLAWLEQQTGKEAAETEGDETGMKPWQEIANIVRRVASLMGVPVPEFFGQLAKTPADQEVVWYTVSDVHGIFAKYGYNNVNENWWDFREALMRHTMKAPPEESSMFFRESGILLSKLSECGSDYLQRLCGSTSPHSAWQKTFWSGWRGERKKTFGALS